MECNQWALKGRRVLIGAHQSVQEAELVTNYIVALSSYRPSTVSLKAHFTGMKQT